MTLGTAVALVAMIGVVAQPGPVPAVAAGPPAGFSDTVLIGDLKLPTNVAFAPDGRMFVNEKRGVIKVYDSPEDTTAEVVADLRTAVWNYSDSGLNGLAVDPLFPARPYIYISYAYDAPPGGTAPTWGTAGADDDACTVTDVEHCVTQGRVSRLTLDGNRAVAEDVLFQASCHPFSSHGIDDVQFGPDGSLYATVGDGSTSSFADYGQEGNRCADPPVAAGATQQPATSQAGSLRSQDLRTSGDPAGLNGALVRVSPDTGAAAAGNPMLSDPDVNVRRVIAYGLRNAFRFTFRPGSQEVYVADVGWNSFEEINLVADVDDAVVENFGWPCYEGSARQGSWDNMNNQICEQLYTEGSAKSPYYSYPHNTAFPTGGSCPDNDAGANGGLRFYPGGSFPDEYDGGLFFMDFTRHCLMFMDAGADGRPLPSTLREFSTTTPWSADLEVGPGGDLYYLDVYFGDLHRIRYAASNQPPTAAVTVAPSSGPVGTTFRFDASASRDPEGGALTFSWDLDGDGALDDGSGATISRRYDTPGQVSVTVEARDPSGSTARASTSVLIGGAAPTPVIAVAPGSQTWATGEQLTFTGSATDGSGSAVPDSALTWTSTLFHCEPAGCHPHPLSGGTGSTLSFAGPDHSAPAYIEVTLTARDANGVTGTATVRADPETAPLTIATNPSGLQVALDGEVATTPFTRTVIKGSQHSVSAADQSTSSGSWAFTSWSDGGAASHNITGPATATTLTATLTSTGTVGTNLLANGTLATGSPVPTCFALNKWGTNTVTGQILTDLPAGASGRSYATTVSGYSSGDARLLPSTASGCAATVEAGKAYTVGLSYKTTATKSSLLAYTFNGTKWVYWTKLTALPATPAWTAVSRATPAVPAGVTRIAFAAATESNGTTTVADLSVRN